MSCTSHRTDPWTVGKMWSSQSVTGFCTRFLLRLKGEPRTQEEHNQHESREPVNWSRWPAQRLETATVNRKENSRKRAALCSKEIVMKFSSCLPIAPSAWLIFLLLLLLRIGDWAHTSQQSLDRIPERIGGRPKLPEEENKQSDTCGPIWLANVATERSLYLFSYLLPYNNKCVESDTLVFQWCPWPGEETNINGWGRNGCSVMDRFEKL